MTLLNDREILELCLSYGMISPFEDRLHRHTGVNGLTPAISYGLSSAGYDISLSEQDFRIFRRLPGDVVDPKAFTDDHLQWVDVQRSDRGDRFFILPAHSYALGVTVESFWMPSDVVGVCVGKSTYARTGIIVNVTPLEPGWRGHLTLEISNSSDSDCRIYANEGIAQVQFHCLTSCPDTTYADRNGKYQDQAAAVTLAKV